MLSTVQAFIVKISAKYRVKFGFTVEVFSKS